MRMNLVGRQVCPETQQRRYTDTNESGALVCTYLKLCRFVEDGHRHGEEASAYIRSFVVKRLCTPSTISSAVQCICSTPYTLQQCALPYFSSLDECTHMKAKAVLRRQCLGSAHQPPAGDHTPAPRTLESSTTATTNMLMVDARPTGAGHCLLPIINTPETRLRASGCSDHLSDMRSGRRHHPCLLFSKPALGCGVEDRR